MLFKSILPVFFVIIFLSIHGMLMATFVSCTWSNCGDSIQDSVNNVIKRADPTCWKPEGKDKQECKTKEAIANDESTKNTANIAKTATIVAKTATAVAENATAVAKTATAATGTPTAAAEYATKVAGNATAVAEAATAVAEAVTVVAENAAAVDFKNAVRLQEYHATRYSRRVNWELVTLLYIVACIIVLFVAIDIIYQTKSGKIRLPCWKISISTVAVLYVSKDTLRELTGKVPIIIWRVLIPIIAVLVGFILFLNSDLHMVIISSIIKATIKGMEADGESKFMRDNILTAINAVISIGYGVIVFIMAAITVVLYRTLSVTCVDRTEGCKKELETLSGNMMRLRTLLYSSALMLAVGVILIQSIYQWSLAFVDGTTANQQSALTVANGFTSTLTIFSGIFFSALLSAAFLPAIYIIQNHAARMVEKITPTDSILKETTREDYLKKYNLSFAFDQQLPRVIAVLTPLITAPIAELVKAFIT